MLIVCFRLGLLFCACPLWRSSLPLSTRRSCVHHVTAAMLAWNQIAQRSESVTFSLIVDIFYHIIKIVHLIVQASLFRQVSLCPGGICSVGKRMSGRRCINWPCLIFTERCSLFSSLISPTREFSWAVLVCYLSACSSRRMLIAWVCRSRTNRLHTFLLCVGQH